jgi:hypothetical protein
MRTVSCPMQADGPSEPPVRHNKSRHDARAFPSPPQRKTRGIPLD